jgi:mono/diheme cytochrome c family protein
MRTAIALVVLLVAAASASAQSAVERGKYLVEVLGACGNCHTPKGPSGEIRAKHLAGGFVIEEPFGAAVTPNITPDRETGIGGWTDEEIIRAIREGKRKDGRTLGPPMPYYLYRQLSDTDVRAMVAYLRTVKPVRNQVPPSRYKITLPASYGPPVGPVPDVPRTDPVKYGAYLAGPVGHCVDCHTPRGAGGKPDETKFSAGGFDFHGPFGTSYSANITPDPETGIGTWKDSEIIAGLYGARRGGGKVLAPMPSPSYAAGIQEADLKAIVAYLRTLPPIRNRVPAPVAPKKP